MSLFLRNQLATGDNNNNNDEFISLEQVTFINEKKNRNWVLNTTK